VLRELIDDLDDWDVLILATDISQAALATASLGVYSDFEMSRGMPVHLRDRYFRKVTGGWKISDEIRALVSFENRNLLKPFPTQSGFEVIFCRNVAIYFDAAVKRDLFERLAGALAPHGALFVGSSENLSAFGEKWKPQYHCRGVFYQPNRKAVDAVNNRPAAMRPASSVPATQSRPALMPAKR
jgi:chemotaxis protein methyltransferase CheR